MADKIIEKAVNLLKQDSTFSTQNNLHRVYQKFEENDSHISSNICKNDNDLNTKFNLDEDILNVCKRVERILNKWNYICSTNNDISDNTCCDFLIYWIYGELIKKNYTSYNVHWLYRKIQNLLENNEHVTSKNLNCNGNFKRVFAIENLKSKKYLHDFLEYFDSIKRILQSETPDKKDYCDYIYYILQLYNSIKEACYTRIPEACPDEIKLFQDKIKGDDLSLVKNNCLRNLSKFKLSNMNAILDQLKKELTIDKERVENPFKYRKLINYDIFHYLKKYQEEEKSTQGKQKNVSNETEEQCTKINSGDHDEHTKLEKICKEFILYFFNFPKTKINSIHFFDYMNYWLNEKLKTTKTKATDFIGIMDKNLSYNFSSNSLYKRFKRSVYDMNGNILEEMNILHNLHDEYNKFLENLENECTVSDNKCLSTYLTEINKCYHNKNKKFQKSLNNILSMYNKKYQKNCKGKKPDDVLPSCKIVERYITNKKPEKCVSSCQNFENKNLRTSSKGKHEYVYYISIFLNIFTNSFC
ncbi:hypothetical protein PVBG_05385 [Plasmodium vivax Brazil I]|uniref:PIR Superfamily Protein n=1 Tax=Plasmodium vivax (strain Brazil I) TaxID=1033975 RepID=A0A0J9T029_PLAV1|nr:hypothetical protein PVBG_05385 [Plasmodium vivax Brazil I]